MVYHPYFRGKQFELLAIRETAELMARNSFVPIIEPVKASLKGLERALNAVSEAEGSVIVVVNPHHGDHGGAGEAISELLDEFEDEDRVCAGVLLKGEMSANDAVQCLDDHAHLNPHFIHAGFVDPKGLCSLLGRRVSETPVVYFEDHASLLYRRNFQEAPARILLRDGFQRMKNADYPSQDSFSDLHVTFDEMRLTGFGDFLTVGDVFSESGGPAYAVAIHLSYIDEDKDDAMFLYHFVSKSNDTPTDPAGKFGEALDALISHLDSGTSKLYETSAISEFRKLQQEGHFPGLGYVKKLSMIHHIETMAEYFNPTAF